jgi:hypothetical protein
MSKRTIIAIIAVLALQVQALNVQNTAGTLSTRISDMNVTSLTVSGTMNAEDFYFIADNLHALSVIDLSTVTVTACRTAELHYWQQDFDEGELPAGSFGAMALTSVTLPSSLKRIGKGAFAACNQLTSVTLPATLDSIGDYAFAACSALETVTLPASVVKVGRGAFMRCTALTTLQVQQPSRLQQLDATALMDCPALTTVKLGNALQALGERSLAGTGIQQLDLTGSTSLNDVGDWAMVKTPVTQAKLPSSVKTAGDGVFLYDTALDEATLGGSLMQLSDYMFAGTGLTALDLTGVNALGDYALYNLDRMTVVELPATVTWLGTRSMAGMISMTEITSNATQVPDLGENVWQGVNQSQIPLTVPASATALYQEAEQWKEFMISTGWLMGDVNADGEVNIADVNVVVRIIQGKDYDEGTMMRADVNGDGEINIADINVIIRIIQTGSAKSPAHVNVNDQLHLDDVALRPGEERTLAVTLDNASDYNALQCDIILPEGLSLVNSKVDRNHTSETCGLDESTSRTVLYSAQTTHFDEDCAVLYITVRADNALAHDSQIQLSNIVLADADDVAWHAADCTAQVKNSTGIEDLNAMADRIWAEGRTLCIDSRLDGTAQVNAINGTMRSFRLTAGVNRYDLEAGFYVVVLNGKSHKIAIK